MEKTISYTREHGTRVTMPANADDRMAAIRAVVDQKQYAKIDNCMIDLFSALHIVRVYEALNDKNKAKFASLPAPRMATIAFGLME